MCISYACLGVAFFIIEQKLSKDGPGTYNTVALLCAMASLITYLAYLA
nr:MAG TPA: hypothetical protein [Caudoviricetes sp.]